VLELTLSRGADLALEFSGQPEAFQTGLDVLRAGGRFVLAGATFPSVPAPMPVEHITRRMLHIVGEYNYGPEDLDAALEFLARSHARSPFETPVARTFPLEAVNDAFAYAEEERPPRVALRPQSRAETHSMNPSAIL
jgi:threonine dehydrogenase-like Zn-dependent dehydrogenase